MRSFLLLLAVGVGCDEGRLEPMDGNVDGLRLGPNAAVSFHAVDRADPWAWDAILDLYEATGATMLLNQNRPDEILPHEWAFKVHTSHYANGTAMGQGIAAVLLGPEAPAYVIIDETTSASHPAVADAARWLRDNHPELAGRWGAYLVNGLAVSYTNLQPAVDELLRANAIVLPEMYVAQSAYCGSASSAGSRDIWLAGFFSGDDQGFGRRTRYLVDRRAALGSDSQISPVFGVMDSYGDGTYPAIFIDRMFYVWRTRSGFPSLISFANGGPSAWKWDQPSMSNTSRDLAWAESFDHYVLNERTSSRLGQVICD